MTSWLAEISLRDTDRGWVSIDCDIGTMQKDLVLYYLLSCQRTCTGKQRRTSSFHVLCEAKETNTTQANEWKTCIAFNRLSCLEVISYYKKNPCLPGCSFQRLQHSADRQSRVLIGAPSAFENLALRRAKHVSSLGLQPALSWSCSSD